MQPRVVTNAIDCNICTDRDDAVSIEIQLGAESRTFTICWWWFWCGSSGGGCRRWSENLCETNLMRCNVVHVTIEAHERSAENPIESAIVHIKIELLILKKLFNTSSLLLRRLTTVLSIAFRQS